MTSDSMEPGAVSRDVAGRNMEVCAEVSSAADCCAPVGPAVLDEEAAALYGDWFATLADSTRVRLLYHVATSGSGVRVGEMARELRISQSTCSHHVQKLAAAGFVTVEKVGTASVVAINPACCTGLPHAADVVMGTLATVPCCPRDLPGDVSVRAMVDADVPRALEIYAQGIEGRNATFETRVPSADEFATRHLSEHRWVAERPRGESGAVVGWAALAPVSARECYAGVGETAVYVDSTARGAGVGKALLHRLVTQADAAGFWTLQASVFPENRASVALHRAAGFRTLAVRAGIAQLDGVWRDTVLLERRAAAVEGATLSIP